MVTFGKRVRQLRRANGLTIRQVAEAIERDFTYVSKIENDRVLPPSAEVIVSLATLLGADPEELAVLGDKPPVGVLRQQLAEAREENGRLRFELTNAERERDFLAEKNLTDEQVATAQAFLDERAKATALRDVLTRIVAEFTFGDKIEQCIHCGEVVELCRCVIDLGRTALSESRR